MEKPSRYVVIPAKVLYDRRLNDKQKILLGVINNLSNWKGYCFANNDYLSRAIGCSVRQLQRDLDILVRVGYVTKQIDTSDAGVEKRLLHVNDLPPTTLMTSPHDKNDTPPTSDLSPIKTNSKNKEYLTLYTHEFEFVWEAYGKHGVKLNAAKAWSRLSPDERSIAKEHLIEYVKLHTDVNKMEFLPHLATYLNQRRFESEMPYTREENPKVKHRTTWADVSWS